MQCIKRKKRKIKKKKKFNVLSIAQSSWEEPPPSCHKTRNWISSSQKLHPSENLHLIGCSGTNPFLWEKIFSNEFKRTLQEKKKWNRVDCRRSGTDIKSTQKLKQNAFQSDKTECKLSRESSSSKPQEQTNHLAMKACKMKHDIRSQ